MKAIGIRRFGGKEVLENLDLPIPSPKAHEVLVKIKAAGVNPVDCKIREGLFHGRMPHHFPIVLGWDAAGIVERVGEKVHYAEAGQEVFAYCRKDILQDGCYGEYITLSQSHLAMKPDNLSFAEAAALPLAGLTAYQCLFEALKLKGGETILIHAGAGGVGGFAIQMAKILGAYVITTSSKGHHAYVESLGVDRIIDYTQMDFRDALKGHYPEGIDAVFDTVGGEVQTKSAEVLKKDGRFVSILSLMKEPFQSRGIEAHYVFVRPEHSQLNQIKAWCEQGLLKVHLSETLPLEEAVQAQEKIQAGHMEGKLVLEIPD